MDYGVKNILHPNNPHLFPIPMLAYLISAYRDPAHLCRLVKALDHEADFYIHIDANVDEAPFRRLLPATVRFVPRHRVSWGGWEQVAYQYELLRAALASGRTYSHLVCLSGQDYPLWSNQRIHAFFNERAGREFICGHNLTHTDSLPQRQKITCVHPFRDLPWRSRRLKNLFVVASRRLLRTVGVRRRPTVRIGGRTCDVYFGSDYWALTPACAAYVVEILATQPGVARYFRTTFVPSELCIQTLVFNSPFAANALLHEGSYPGLSALTPLHFIDYGACIKELTTDDWPRLVASKKMFCRKVVTGPSDALALRIDRERA